MGQNENNVNRKDPVQFWLIMAACSLLLIAFVLPTRTVEADAVLSRPAATAPPAAPVINPTPVVVHKSPNKLIRGFASWYGGVFNGRQTASGETFDQNEMTACHPTLPFGTRVKVENTRNHKSVIVRITDRGLLYGRRVIDLSYAAAEKIGMTEVGVVPVTIQVLPKPEAN